MEITILTMTCPVGQIKVFYRLTLQYGHIYVFTPLQNLKSTNAILFTSC